MVYLIRAFIAIANDVVAERLGKELFTHKVGSCFKDKIALNFVGRRTNGNKRTILYCKRASIGLDKYCKMYSTTAAAGLPDFSWCMIPKPEKCTK
jgi:hypothetical protein